MSRPASSGLPAAPSHHPCVARLPNTARLPAARAVGRTSGCTATSSCTSSSSSSSSSSSGHSRRELLLRTTPAALLPLLAAGLGTDDPTTILNSVLSAYGLPTLAATKGFKAYDDFEQGFLLEYPRSWVSRPNTLRKGFYVSDYQTSDKATVEVFPVPEDGDVVRAAVVRAVVPTEDQQSDKLDLPPARLIKTQEQDIDGMLYTYIQFPSETITRSGYQIKRKNFAVVATKRGVVYTLNASARSDQYNKDKEALLRYIVQSFRVL